MNTKILTKILAFITATVLSVSVLASCTVPAADNNAAKYTEALELLANRDYAGAKAIFETLGDYKDTKKHLERFRYVPVMTDSNYFGMYGYVRVEFNEQGMPVREVGAESDEAAVNEFFYDENGALVKVVETYGDSVSVDTYTYDENGRLATVSYDYGDDYTFTYTYTYDANGLLITTVYVNSDGDTGSYNYAYDEHGNMIREEVIGEGGTTVTEYECIYENGRLVKYISKYEDGTTTYVVTEYDEQGRVAKEIYHYDFGTYSFGYTYDEFGNLVKETLINTNGVEEYKNIEYVLLYVTYTLNEGTEKLFADRWGYKI